MKKKLLERLVNECWDCKELKTLIEVYAKKYKISEEEAYEVVSKVDDECECLKEKLEDLGLSWEEVGM